MRWNGMRKQQPSTQNKVCMADFKGLLTSYSHGPLKNVSEKRRTTSDAL